MGKKYIYVCTFNYSLLSSLVHKTIFNNLFIRNSVGKTNKQVDGYGV